MNDILLSQSFAEKKIEGLRALTGYSPRKQDVAIGGEVAIEDLIGNRIEGAASRRLTVMG